MITPPVTDLNQNDVKNIIQSVVDQIDPAAHDDMMEKVHQSLTRVLSSQQIQMQSTQYVDIVPAAPQDQPISNSVMDFGQLRQQTTALGVQSSTLDMQRNTRDMVAAFKKQRELDRQAGKTGSVSLMNSSLPPLYSAEILGQMQREHFTDFGVTDLSLETNNRMPNQTLLIESAYSKMQKLLIRSRSAVVIPQAIEIARSLSSEAGDAQRHSLYSNFCELLLDPRYAEVARAVFSDAEFQQQLARVRLECDLNRGITLLSEVMPAEFWLKYWRKLGGASMDLLLDSGRLAYDKRYITRISAANIKKYWQLADNEGEWRIRGIYVEGTITLGGAENTAEDNEADPSGISMDMTIFFSEELSADRLQVLFELGYLPDSWWEGVCQAAVQYAEDRSSFNHNLRYLGNERKAWLAYLRMHKTRLWSICMKYFWQFEVAMQVDALHAMIGVIAGRQVCNLLKSDVADFDLRLMRFYDAMSANGIEADIAFVEVLAESEV